MARSFGPCAAASLFVLFLLPLLIAACPTSPMSPAASPYGYEAMFGTGPAAYPSPFIAAPGAAPPAATAPVASPRAEEDPPVALEAGPAAGTAPPASPRAEEEPPVAPEAGSATATAPPRAEEEPPVAPEAAPAGEHVQRLHHLARTLDFLGYREMASSAPLLVSSTVLASWSGPWTVFAIPDAEFRAGCAARACTHLMEHVTLGGTVRSDVAAEPYSITKLSTAAVGKCITASVSTNGPETLWVNGVEVSEPDLYIDDRLVIHGVKTAVKVPKRRSCSLRLPVATKFVLGLPGRVESSIGVNDAASSPTTSTPSPDTTTSSLTVARPTDVASAESSSSPAPSIILGTTNADTPPRAVRMCSCECTAAAGAGRHPAIVKVCQALKTLRALGVI